MPTVREANNFIAVDIFFLIAELTILPLQRCQQLVRQNFVVVVVAVDNFVVQLSILPLQRRQQLVKKKKNTTLLHN